MRRIFLSVVFLLIAIPIGWHLLRPGESAEEKYTRPSAIERTLANVFRRLDLVIGWAEKVEEKELLWQITESMWLKGRVRIHDDVCHEFGGP